MDGHLYQIEQSGTIANGLLTGLLDGHGSKWTVIGLKTDGPSGKNGLFEIAEVLNSEMDGPETSKWTVKISKRT